VPRENISGPTVTWSEIEDKKVKSHDDKTMGRIKEISQNHIRVQKGSVRKSSFWVPKNLADAYDGKYLWLKSNKKQIQDKFFYGEEPPESDQTGSPVERVRVVNERMAGIPTKPTDPSEEYKNIRDVE
jgi:hypothetical protein